MTDDRSDRKVRFRSSSVESQDDVLSTIDENRRLFNEVDKNHRLFNESDKNHRQQLIDVDENNRRHIQHTCSKSQSGENFSSVKLKDFASVNEKLLSHDRVVPLENAKKSERKQFRPHEDRGSKGRTLPRVQTLPSGGFYKLQRPSDDVVIETDLLKIF